MEEGTAIDYYIGIHRSMHTAGAFHHDLRLEVLDVRPQQHDFVNPLFVLQPLST